MSNRTADERVFPVGCVCRREDWECDVIPALCAEFEMLVDENFIELDICANCAHDKGCHG